MAMTRKSVKRGKVVLASLMLLSCSGFACSDLYAASGKIQENKDRLLETNSCLGCDLSGVNLDQANLPGVNLEGANLTRANLNMATLTKANLRNAILRGAELSGANLADSDLRGADLRGADFTGAYLLGTKLDPKPVPTLSSEKVEANQAVTQQQEISAASGNIGDSIPSEEPGFLAKTWGGVMGLLGFSEADEKNATDDQSVQTGKADLLQNTAEPQRNVEVEEEVVNNISSVQAEDTSLVEGLPSEMSEAVVEEEPSGAAEEAVVESTVPSARKDNPLQAPSQVEMDNNKIAVPENVKLNSAADIEKNKQRLLDTKKCYGCDLTGVDLTNKNLAGVDLEGADLTGSRLAGADLEKANLKGAVLIGADLKDANLEGADLYKANLSKADLTGAELKDALLDDVQVSGTIGYE